MRCLTLKVRAPESSTQLAALERSGFFGVGQDTEAPQEEQKSVWTTISEDLVPTLNTLVNSGMEWYSARNERQYAQEQAAITRQQAALQERMAQAEAESAKREQERMEMLLRQQQRIQPAAPQQGGSGIPWTPIALGGAALVGVFLMTRKRAGAKR